MRADVITVKGMSCEHCVKAVEDALAPLGAKGEVDLGAGTVKVTYNESSVSIETIREAIEEQGYETNA
ncbi:cation transporter [Paenibacillus sp. 1P07SE]|uniref:cation transporter n=1 Tax=Paenibacillus sp. 1P07SE TaxID=3132209 RepID=UPI0039A560EE